MTAEREGRVGTPPPETVRTFEGKAEFLDRIGQVLATYVERARIWQQQPGPQAKREERYMEGAIHGISLAADMIGQWQVTPHDSHPADPPTMTSADGTTRLRRWKVEGVVYAPDMAAASKRLDDARLYVDRLSIAAGEAES